MVTSLSHNFVFFFPCGFSPSVSQIFYASIKLRTILLTTSITSDSVNRNFIYTLRTAIAYNGPHMILYARLAEVR